MKEPSTGQRFPDTTDDGSASAEAPDLREELVLALTIAWSSEEPHRVGEVAFFDPAGGAQVLGRDEVSSARGRRVVFYQQRPAGLTRTPALKGASISREQLRVEAVGARLRVERVGRCPMSSRGRAVERAELTPGDTLLLKGQLLLFCTLRPRVIPALRDFPRAAIGPFGAPDAVAFLGESPAMWRVRDAVAFHGKAAAHALVLGPSGAGKELAARAIHRLSPRAEGPFIARNAATIPHGLIDAELFGNVRNYPNPGMPERPGLIGAAHGGTLFLDEVGELPSALHANFLRVLDGDGEYHRLGDARARRADVRLIAATNRSCEVLKHDLLARLPLRLQVPGLDERRDDIPLLVRHLLRGALEKSPEIVGRFVRADGEVRVTGELVEHLLHRTYTANVRELEGLLWRSMAASPGAALDLPEDMRQERTHETVAKAPPVAVGAALAARSPREHTAEELRARIFAHEGNLARAARELGLPSRFALYRLLRRHGIALDELRGEKG